MLETHIFLVKLYIKHTFICKSIDFSWEQTMYVMKLFELPIQRCKSDLYTFQPVWPFFKGKWT